MRRVLSLLRSKKQKKIEKKECAADDAEGGKHG